MRTLGRISLVLLAAVGARNATAAARDAFFGPRPRLEYLQADLDAWPSNRVQACLAKAEAILERGLVISDQEGQWIFYYACPDDDARLKPESPERHLCPRCGKVFTDARTLAAYQTVLHYQLDDDVHALALAWALGRDERFASAARQAFLELVRIYPTLTRHDRWGRRGLLAIVGGRRYCQHLDEAISVIKLARAYDLVAEAPCFDATDRRRIERGLLRRVCTEIRNRAWLMERRNNHQTWFNAAYATVGVAIGDAGLLRNAIENPYRGLLWQLDYSVTADGLWYEGAMAYHFYALSAIIDTLEAAQRAGWNYADHARLKSLWLGPLQMAYPDGRVPVINDSDPGSLQGRKAFYAFARRYFDDPRFDTDDLRQPLASAALQGAGLVALRRGAGDDARCLFFDYGIHGGHHGHPDKLNITLYTLGREVILDPGRLTYSVPEHTTWARTTVAHNTVVIDRKDQRPTEGRLLWFDDTPEYAGALAETTGAYPGYTLRRGLIMTQAWLLDVVTVDGAAPAGIDLLLHVRGRLQESGTPVGLLGDSDGYQHLREIVRHPDAQRRFSFEQPDKRVLTIHTWPDLPAWSGSGIGYTLKDPVPFLLRRRQAPGAVFVTLYDLGGSGVELLECGFDRTVCRATIRSGDVVCTVTFDTAPTAPSRLHIARTD